MSGLVHEPPAGVPTLQAELLLDVRAQLGEGPVWDAAAQCLWWVDILGEAVHRTDIATSRDRVFPVGQMIGAAALRESGDLVLAVEEGFLGMDAHTGDLDLIAPVEKDDPVTRMNDGKVDPAGRFWAGTTAIDHRPGAGTLYRLDPDRRVTPVLPDVTISNGLDWSLDGRTMYYIDTPTRRVDRFVFDASTGAISAGEPAVSIREGAGDPDGMTLDADGFLWVALWGGWAVERYAPDGRLDRRVEVPAAQASSCAFGGPDLDLLLITTARKDFPPEGRPDQPNAGSLFVCRPGVRGRAPFRYAG